MNRLVPALALLLAAAPATAAGTVDAANDAPAANAPSTAMRFSGGASASFTVSARIVRAPDSASVGAGLGPPAPFMVPRATTVSAADGAPVPALVYDFE